MNLNHQCPNDSPNLGIGLQPVLGLVPILFCFWRHRSASWLRRVVLAWADYYLAASAFDQCLKFQFWHHSDLDMMLHHLDLENIPLGYSCNNFFCLKYYFLINFYQKYNVDRKASKLKWFEFLSCRFSFEIESPALHTVIFLFLSSGLYLTW